jgi:excisionase family DNA binding protein
MHQEGEKYYSTAEVGERLGVSRQRIDQLLKSGELAGEQDTNTGRWRISSEALDEYLSTHQPRTPRRRLEDHPAFEGLKGEVKDLHDRLSGLEVRLGVVERLLGELRSTLLESIYKSETDGITSESEKNKADGETSSG